MRNMKKEALLMALAAEAMLQSSKEKDDIHYKCTIASNKSKTPLTKAQLKRRKKNKKARKSRQKNR